MFSLSQEPEAASSQGAPALLPRARQKRDPSPILSVSGASPSTDPLTISLSLSLYSISLRPSVPPSVCLSVSLHRGQAASSVAQAAHDPCFSTNSAPARGVGPCQRLHACPIDQAAGRMIFQSLPSTLVCRQFHFAVSPVGAAGGRVLGKRYTVFDLRSSSGLGSFGEQRQQHCMMGLFSYSMLESHFGPAGPGTDLGGGLACFE